MRSPGEASSPPPLRQLILDCCLQHEERNIRTEAQRLHASPSVSSPGLNGGFVSSSLWCMEVNPLPDCPPISPLAESRGMAFFSPEKCPPQGHWTCRSLLLEYPFPFSSTFRSRANPHLSRGASLKTNPYTQVRRAPGISPSQHLSQRNSIHL